MKNLFAPWRERYASDVDTEDSKKEGIKADKCVFCAQLEQDNDKQNFILRRFDYTYVMLNKYPYNAGHLLILPLRHVSSLSQLSRVERAELMELANQSIEILKKTLKNDGLNVGINLGRAAGAGIPSHLHVHALPRWSGDTNFMPAIAQTKVISFDLQKFYDKLKPKLNNITL